MNSYVRALYEFNGEPGTSEISITVGEVLYVTRTDVGDGWWEGKNERGQVGLFPAAYVEVMRTAQIHDNNQNTNHYNNSSTAYDQTPDDINDADDWEDDWDDDNDTYSQIENVSKQIPRSDATSSYENKNLPVTPNDLSASNSFVSNAPLKKSGMFGKASDSFILGLGAKDVLLESQKVHIFQNGTSYYWAANDDPYTVLVTSPKKESKFKGMKTFIAYQLTPSFNNISVSRRYKHFDWLHERLVEKFFLIPIPPLPDKQISGRYEEQFIEHRRIQLQEFVDWVCRHPVLSKCEVWQHFLTCTDEKVWKLGKRKAERDVYVGMTYCWAIVPPEKQLLPSFVESQLDSCSQFIHLMDAAVKNLLVIVNDTGKRYQTQCKKEFQRIGDGLSEIAKALNIDERRSFEQSGKPLSEKFGRIGGMFINIGQMYGDQPKLDWVPFSDRLHIYRGILNTFPDIISIHKGAIQKRKECEKLAAEQKMGNQQLADVNRRTDVISYAAMAEMSHFKNERDTHLKKALKYLMEEQIKFHKSIVEKLQEAYLLFD